MRTAGLLLAMLLPAIARGQASPAPFAPWRALLGEVAIDLRVLSGEVRIGFAGDTTQVTLVLRPSDLRRFADSIARRVAARRDKRFWSFRIEEPGVSAGAMSVSAERAPDGTLVYRLFAADDVLRSVRDSIGAAEVRVLARKLRQAALAATPPAALRRRPARKP